MLSGIGPAEHLRQKNIRPVINLKGVGQNLQDHVAAGGITFLFDSPPWTKPYGAGMVLPRLFTLNTYYSFLFDKSGPIYSSPFCEVMAFVNTK
jgi:choline dehydrogenase-like flavoprotein